MPFDGLSPQISTSQRRFDRSRHFHYNPHLLFDGKADAAPSIFFERALEHIIPEMVDFEHAKINARRIFPIDRSASAVAKSITWRQRTGFGQAAIIADYADDVNIVGESGEEFTTSVRGIAVGAEWSVMEIRAASEGGYPLERSYAMDAREAMLRLENQIAFNGDAAFGLQGLASGTTGIPQNAAPTGTWTVATAADDILADLHFAANTIPEVTGDVEVPNTLLLPTTAYNLIASRKHGTDSDRTILQVFLQNSPYIREVIPVRELETLVGGGRVAVAYDRNPSKLRMEVPLDIEQFAPQQTGMVIRVIWHMRIGGLIVFKPASLHIVTGI